MGKARNERKADASTRHFGPMFNKQLGQHILKNPLVVDGIVDKVWTRCGVLCRLVVDCREAHRPCACPRPV